MTYAAQTNVAVPKSRAEVERLVLEAGGTRFGTMTEPGRAVVFFELKARRVMFELPLPQLQDFATRKHPRRSWAVDVPRATQERLLDQATRARWRALVLALKAKLVSVESGVEQFEEAFLGQIVVPTADGRPDRFYNVAVKHLRQAYEQGLPPLLGAGS